MDYKKKRWIQFKDIKTYWNKYLISSRIMRQNKIEQITNWNKLDNNYYLLIIH